MSKEEIRIGRIQDAALKEAYFNKVSQPWWLRSMREIMRWLSKLLE